MSCDILNLSSKLKIIGDPTRLAIVAYLKARELCVCDLVELLGLSQPAISQHLKKLKQAEIIKERKVGTWVHVSLISDPEPYLKEIIRALPSESEVIDAYIKTRHTSCS